MKDVRNFGGTTTDINTIGGQNVLTSYNRIGPGPCERAVQIEAMTFLYLDAQDRVLATRTIAVLPSNVRPPPAEATQPPAAAGRE